MKSAEEWTNLMAVCAVKGARYSLTHSQIKQIQLDAMKEGARRAAASLDVMVGEPVTTSERARKLCYNAILSTAEQWTLNDL